MNALTNGRPDQAEEARHVILVRRDTRFIAVLIELLRAGQIGFLPASDDQANVHALQALSGQTFGAEWPAWTEWYGGTALVPPPGFMGWKGRLLARADPRFADFLRDGAPSRIRPEEIEWGGVPVDGILALTHPAMIRAAVASYLTPSDPVFGLAINGDARAYPQRRLLGRQGSRRLPAGIAQRGVHRLREIREFARREQVPEDIREHLCFERVAAHELAVRAHCGTAIVVARAAEMPRAGAVVLHHVVPAALAGHAEAGEQVLRPGAPRPEPATRGRGQMTNVFVAGGTGVLGALVGSRPAADEFGVRLRSISVTARCHS